MKLLLKILSCLICINFNATNHLTRPLSSLIALCNESSPKNDEEVRSENFQQTALELEKCIASLTEIVSHLKRINASAMKTKKEEEEFANKFKQMSYFANSSSKSCDQDEPDNPIKESPSHSVISHDSSVGPFTSNEEDLYTEEEIEKLEEIRKKAKTTIFMTPLEYHRNALEPFSIRTVAYLPLMDKYYKFIEKFAQHIGEYKSILERLVDMDTKKKINFYIKAINKHRIDMKHGNFHLFEDREICSVIDTIASHVHNINNQDSAITLYSQEINFSVYAAQTDQDEKEKIKNLCKSGGIMRTIYYRCEGILPNSGDVNHLTFFRSNGAPVKSILDFAKREIGCAPKSLIFEGLGLELHEAGYFGDNEHNLKIIRLINCEIKEWSSKDERIGGLKEVNVGFNELESLPPCKLMNGIQSLFMTGNRLHKLTSESLKGLYYPTIGGLCISHNILTDQSIILKSLHAMFPHLTHLWIEGNGITNFDLTQFKHLMYFNMSKQINKQITLKLSGKLEKLIGTGMEINIIQIPSERKLQSIECSQLIADREIKLAVEKTCTVRVNRN
ncbi:hypothetical protein FZC35_00065 [Candidatus Cytomitobacter indipagum]|uniref:Leucine-rich repeat domain-containing protein n=1 Tax=Candidatus Cytomitobacter indipagum TaxID=2601575 RepID=A0A5C0UEU5_9PROT|nr:hypothetical protein [Candidatus Cytomitobacter indipagum]QEK37792.1 hypothetical protein FZC35_00065 [Candidatus Cytomitobacter indipagum]